MKRLILVLVLSFALLVTACGSNEVIGEYATDAFNEKFSAYVEMYNQLLYNPNSLSTEINNYFTSVYGESDQPDYSLGYAFSGSPNSDAMMVAAERYISEEPALPELDAIVRQVIDGSRKIMTTLTDINSFYVSNTGDDYAPVAELEARLQSEIDAANGPINQMSDEIDRLQLESDKQMITRYESNKNMLGAEVLRATMLMHNFSRNLDRHLDGERVDTAAYEQDLAAFDKNIQTLIDMAGDDNHLLNAGMDKAQVDGAIQYFQQAQEPARQMLEHMKNQETIPNETIQAFDAAFFGYIDYYNESMR